MAVVNNVNETLHRIRVKLYPCRLPGAGGYIARTDDEAALDIEAVCAALKNRGGSTAQYDDLVEHVKQFFDEAAYQLCEGFAVNTGYFSLHPRVGGIFRNPQEGLQTGEHPLSFSFRQRQPLRDLTKHIEVFVEGIAAAEGYIEELDDVASESVSGRLTPGGLFIIRGRRIKVMGDNPSVGVYFAGQDGSGPVKVTSPLAANTGSRVIGVIPALGEGGYRLQIRTQCSAGGTMLKEPRLIESSFLLHVDSSL